MPDRHSERHEHGLVFRQRVNENICCLTPVNFFSRRLPVLITNATLMTP